MKPEMILLMFICTGLATFLSRLLPFIVFSPKRGIPRVIVSLGEKLPSAVMATLVVYCLKDLRTASLSTPQQLICPIAATAIVIITHLIKRNTILSITVGTVVYMLLLRLL